MDYEKKYNEALQKARVINSSKYVDIPAEDTVLEYIFPELAESESEDDRVRKWIIDDIRYNMNNEPLNNSEYKKKAEKAIAWLEKQQGEKPINDTDEEIVEAVKNTSVLDIVSDAHHVYELANTDVVQKEPKFHEGDWIVFNGLVLFIKEVVQGYYRTISRGGIPNSYDWDIDNVARLWTIEDARDGDVLYYKDEISLYKHDIKNLRKIFTRMQKKRFCRKYNRNSLQIKSLRKKNNNL